jgi:L-fucose isomerase-like protein
MKAFSVTRKSTFALFFGNRGFFPASLLAEARAELPRVLQDAGYGTLLADEADTRHGAVGDTREGARYADFLRNNRGTIDGVILCLPNFGDEGGAVAALREAGVPILIQAYPDSLDRMSPAERRDAFCGKLSVANVLRQSGVKFTVLAPHVASPGDEAFRLNIDYFDRICRVVRGLRGAVIGAIGARTTPFRTVRIDEVALQRTGITVQTIDLSEVIARVKGLGSDAGLEGTLLALRASAGWDAVPEAAFDTLARLAAVLRQLADEHQLDALALRCWPELQQQLGISPCIALGALNEAGLTAACEVDVGSAVAMLALGLASDRPATCLDWNNNYGADDDRCVLFHCGPVPASLMRERGRVAEHEILRNSLAPADTWGCNIGRLGAFPFTFGNVTTEEGRLRWYLGQGSLTEDPLPDDYFGCAGVASIDRLQQVLLHIMHNGHHHHVALAPGLHAMPVREALTTYLGHEVALPQWET